MSTALATTVHTKAMPSQLRRMVDKWYEHNVSGGDAATLVKLHASAAVEGVRATGESLAMGSILGAFHALNKTGLDARIPDMVPLLGGHKVPVDALAAVAGFLGGVAIASAPHGMGKTVAQAGATCAGVYSFRQTNDLIVKLREKRTGVTQASNRVVSKADFGGEGGWADGSKSRVQPSFTGEDPLLKAARKL